MNVNIFIFLVFMVMVTILFFSKVEQGIVHFAQKNIPICTILNSKKVKNHYNFEIEN